MSLTETTSKSASLTGAGKQPGKKNDETLKDSTQTPNFGERLKATKENTEKETSDKHQSLSQAKGRAQITATTAMSIVNVALLKNIIDQGHQYNRYYTTSLVLISVSLGLQVFAGILSLIIEHMLSYMSKYQQNMCEDIGENCCPWRCVKSKKQVHDATENGNKPSTVLEMEDLWSSHEDYNVPMQQKGEPTCNCCPYSCTTEVYNHYAFSALQKYYKWRCTSIEVELAAVKAEDEVQSLKELIDATGAEILALKGTTKKTDEATISINEGEPEKFKELQKTLADAKTRWAESKSLLKKAGTIRDQGKVLTEFAESTRKNRVLMLASFWQNVLNYVFYIIFVLNAFITGFGLASGPINADTPSDNTTASSQ